MRFLKEFFSPSLKCKRLGHEFKDKKAIIRKKASSSYNVCEDFKCVIPTCERCGKNRGPKNLDFVDGYSSVSMPASRWDELRENGYLLL